VKLLRSSAGIWVTLISKPQKDNDMKRRFLLTCAAAFAFAPPLRAQTFEFTLTPAQWRERLGDLQYRVLREADTERAGTSTLNLEHRKGTYFCAGCDLALFASDTKYDSGTGWPSFFAPLQDAVGTQIDDGFFGARTEVHCRRCGGHLGHVFDDGPAPTGNRYCMNGVALVFRPALA
jgi:peptide-methionine (R)-S-oxide reductase